MEAPEMMDDVKAETGDVDNTGARPKRELKPNVTLDSEGVLAEKMRMLKIERGQAKAGITRKMNEIKSLMGDSCNTSAAADKVEDVLMALNRFDTVHGLYHGTLTDADDIDISTAYRDSVFRQVKDFRLEVQKWIHESEDGLDSVSQTGSHYSSMSSARVKAASAKAVAQAEAAALREKMRIEREEFRLKQEKQELDMSLRMAKVKATEDALAEELRRAPSPGLNIHAPAFQPRETQHESDFLQLLHLPKMEIMTFDGNPLKYWTFKRVFDTSVGNTNIPDHAKLNRLMQYCVGRARRVIECCVVMEPAAGYAKALQLLKERFGNDFVIAEAWVEKVTKGPAIRSQDHTEMQTFADDLRSCRETLSALGKLQEVDTRRSLCSIVHRLPVHLQHRWRRQAVEFLERTGDYPNLDFLVRFVETAAREVNDPIFGQGADDSRKQRSTPRGMQKPETPAKMSNFNVQAASTPPSHNATATTSQEYRETACVLCKGHHDLFGCEQFKGMKPVDRLKFTRGKGLCDNCLRSGHFALRCPLVRRCSVPSCGKKHTKFLHISPTVNQSNNSFSGSQDETELKSVVHSGYVKTTGEQGASKVILPVVPVKVSAAGSDKTVDTYALLDTGSTNSFCTRKLYEQLGIVGNKTKLTLSTLGKIDDTTDATVVSLTVAGDQDSVKLPFVFVRDKLPVPDSPSASDVENWAHLQDITFPAVGNTDVTILIGQDVPEALIPLEVRKGNRGEPFATRTCLGWTLNGPVGSVVHKRAVCSYVVADVNLEEQVKAFWEIDNVETQYDDTRQMSVKDKEVVDLWSKSMTRVNGHYQLPIPFKREPPELEDNYIVASQRLDSLGRRLQRDPELREKYQRGMQELVGKGYAEQVPQDQLQGPEGRTWYLPHQPVTSDKKPEKVRIVFDCAAKFKGQSLNDKVSQGPDMTNSLVGVLLRFRKERVAITSDIEAMFNQVRVKPEDCDSLRFLWWQDGDMGKEPVQYRMLVHLFGGVWSPSCCNFALKQAAQDAREAYSEKAVWTILRDFYVDDCLHSEPSVQQAIELVGELREVLQKAGFNLTKWLSNDKHVLEAIPEEIKADTAKEIELGTQGLPKERALGVLWDIESDNLGYKIHEKDKPYTRRGVLSVTSSVFDPLGLVCPAILPAKVILQELSRQKLHWDEPLLDGPSARWSSWLNDLPTVGSITLNRCYKPEGFGEVKYHELHHFSDASSVGYGTASYLRTVSEDGLVHCELVMGKSKLNPIKAMTIPRLELSAAALAVRVNKLLRQELEIDIQNTVFWTDSTLVLQYIRNTSARFHTFVSNRVAMIQAGSDVSQWHYVPSGDNPADDASRGMSAKELGSNTRWFHGPRFLEMDEDSWPLQFDHLPTLTRSDAEVKSMATVCTATNSDTQSSLDSLVTHYSSWYRLKRAVAYILRAKRLLLSRIRGEKSGQDTSFSERLSVGELRDAEVEIVRHVQRNNFGPEIDALGSGQSLKRSSPVYKLEAFLDNQGVLCVGGRLGNSPISQERRHPVIMPKDHHVTMLILRHYHESSRFSLEKTVW